MTTWFSIIAMLGLVPLAGGMAALPVALTFDGARSEHVLELRELDPNLPSDWTGFEFLVIEFRAGTSQRFDLGLVTATDRLVHRIGPFPNVWVRASIPLRFYRQPPAGAFDMAATYNQPRNSYWINIHSGKFGPTTNVLGLVFAMENPVGKPTIQIRAVSLAKTDPGDAVLEGLPLVDKFGQYRHVSWPGKATNLTQLVRDWEAEEEALMRSGRTNRCPYGGFIDTRAKATGFFRVEQIDGRWWFVCPDGHLFFSSGVNGVAPSAPTRITGRTELFEELPPAEAMDTRSRRGQSASFYTWNVIRRFGSDWQAKWADLNTLRLVDWGFNTIHNWGVPATNQPRPRVPYAAMLHAWQLGPSIMGMPDVYAEDFEQRVEEVVAAQLAPLRNDPFMFGYFIGNEPPWPGHESQLCDEILAGPESGIKKRLREHLAGGDTPERRRAFAMEAFRRYLDVICRATRKHAPNHLNLGIRFGGVPHDAVLEQARVFDVFSINIYRYAPRRADLDKIFRITGRPILIGEFHIGAPERGLAPGLVMAPDQTERAIAYRYYVEQAAAHPAVVGTHWFQWLDQPCTGRHDGENYNIGFIDVTDRPYRELVEAAKLTHDRIYAVHAGLEKPFDRAPLPVRARASAQ